MKSPVSASVIYAIYMKQNDRIHVIGNRALWPRCMPVELQVTKRAPFVTLLCYPSNHTLKSSVRDLSCLVKDEMLQPGNCRNGLDACISQASRLVELEVLKAVQLVANHPQARVDLASFEV